MIEWIEELAAQVIGGIIVYLICRWLERKL